MKIGLQIFLIFFVTTVIVGQDSISLPQKWIINGYIKDLQTLNFNKNFSELISGNQIHNRFNVKWKPSQEFTFSAEIRNRLFWGEEIKLIPGYATFLRNKNEKIDLQKIWINDKGLVLHSNVERLFVDYRSAKFNLRLGRQRINWGITTIWNPNDIFNVYNFLDFDYEERPGVDGAKIGYILNSASNVEFAYAYTAQKKGNICALKYSLNRWGYDMQFIAGWYNEHPSLGAGWAGNIGDASFQGEAQYFFGKLDSTDHLNMTVEGSYVFEKGWYVNAGFLFNSNGVYQPIQNWEMLNLDLSPENIMPTKWNMIITGSKQLTPLFSGSLSTLYAPGTNLLIFLPSLQYNLDTNLDVSLFWQSFFAELSNHFEGTAHRCFLRMKWSF